MPALSGCGSLDYVVDPSGEPITRVVLKAAPADGGEVTSAAMSKAVDVLAERLDTDERQVDTTVAEGSTVTLDVIGTVGEDDHPLLTEPGELAFRPVLALNGADPGAVSPDVPGVADGVVAEFEDFDCSAERPGADGSGDPDLPLIACDAAGTSTYLLGPVEVDGAAVVEASASYPPESAAWAVILEFDETGTTALSQLTERLQGETSPRNQLAITVDGVVLSAPTIPPGTVITAGVAEISGSFTRESAEALAGQLGTGPLPFPFEVQYISTE
ncbi:SecDF P1 head subdomain-containing protein [Myceligenerans salitolerans]|uniref:SecDF P1 head subdomain domain-containing protein n=1 Tax=Myceligenerans salitolerans TaxID=1230528 RepID=A0ABS3ICU0_9MICO|nr:hypothetical protein [Myceligenerans salitolerans]MBO0610763.1 hypothetical protein [Myceligenerans salitolerans]